MDRTAGQGAAITGEQAMCYVEGQLGFSRQALQVFPKYLCIDPTDQCNAGCVMCGVGQRCRTGRRMPDDLFSKIVSELRGYADHLERVGLFVISEPLLDPGLARKISALKQVRIKCVCLNTNGSLLTPDRSRELIEAGLDRIHISIDSLIPTRYESIRRGLKFSDVYNNTIEFLRIRDELNPNVVVRVQMVLQDSNRDEVESFKDHWRGRVRSTDQIVVTRVFDWGLARGLRHFNDEENPNLIPCTALWSTLEIMASGDVYLCCVDVDGAVKLGNIRDSRIADLWHSPQIERVRKMHLEGLRNQIGLCDGCAVWPRHKHEIKIDAREGQE